MFGSTFHELVTVITPYLKKRDTQLRRPVPVEVRSESRGLLLTPRVSLVVITFSTALQLDFQEAVTMHVSGANQT